LGRGDFPLPDGFTLGVWCPPSRRVMTTGGLRVLYCGKYYVEAGVSFGFVTAKKARRFVTRSFNPRKSTRD